MKGISKLIIRTGVAALMASCFGVAWGADITLKAVTYMPANKFEDSMEVFKSWAQKVKEKTNGKVEVQIIGGPEIFPARDQVSAAGKGLVDVVLTFTSHAGVVPEVNTMPLSDITVQEERKNGYFDLIDKAHEKLNLKFIGRASTDSGFYIFSRKPINRLADFQGMKIRSHAGYSSMFKAVGAIPVGIGISEIYSALERGLVDAAPYNLFIHDMGIAEVTKYVLGDAFWKAHTTMILMNKKKFDSLSPEIQKAIMDAQIDNERTMEQQVKKLKAQEQARLEADGITFTHLPPGEAKEWNRLTGQTRFDDLKGMLPEEKLEKIKTMIVRH